MESILIKVKVLNTCEIDINYGIEIRKFLEKEFEIKKFINSGFFKKNSFSGQFKIGEYYFFRLCFFNKSEENIFAKKTFVNIMKNKKNNIKKLCFIFKEIIYKDSDWAFTFNMDPQEKKETKIEIKSPTLVKIGYEYLNSIDKETFFIKAIINYQKYISKELDKFKILENLNKIEFRTETKNIKIPYKASEINAILGDIFIKNNSSCESFNKDFSRLIESIKFLGIGNRIEDGFGSAQIK